MSDNDGEIIDCEFISSDDDSNDDDTEKTGDPENDYDLCEIHVPEVPRIQKFVNIEKITAFPPQCTTTVYSLLPQEQNVSHYSNAKDTCYELTHW